MEFDEHDYTGRTVENPGPQKARESTVKSGDKDRNQRSRHKNDQKDDGNDGNHRAKYSRSRDENRYHDRRKEGGSSRHRSRSRHRERDRDRGSRELKERDREDRKKDRERERDWERDRHRDRRDCDRYSERERERKQSRRSSSRSERHRSERDERDRERSRDRDREFREREIEREIRERDRKSRKKKEEAAEPVAHPERGQRTVFAYMSRKAGVWDVYDFFFTCWEASFRIRDIRIILDPDSRQPKGCGYIEFFDVESVPKAIVLYGKLLLDQPVLVRRSEAEKNPVWSTNTTTGGARKLCLGYLPVKTTEDQLRQVFGLFGPVESVQLPGEDGNHKGFGLVQFVNPEDARNALTWDGPIKIAGREIRLSKANDPSGMKPVDLGTPATPTTGLPSECFLLTDMFDPTEEAKPDFDLDIKEDLEGECSKYGTLKHIHVHKNCPGLVYLRFDDTESAIAAQSKLHGRWYTMKQITAKFMAPLEYEAKFPDSE